MNGLTISRRSAILGALILPGCTAITRLNAAAEPRDTFDLRPVDLGQGRAITRRTLLVADATAPVALATDRMLIRSGTQSIAYLPDARWSDDVPGLVQLLLVQSLSSSGQIGFVGVPNAGPIPDIVILTRIDRFDVDVLDGAGLRAVLDLTCTLLRDRDQRVITSQQFARTLPVGNDSGAAVASAFQRLMNETLPEITAWTLRNIA
ncbi:ABC-type transport auxiliary lipoprotein family protein [Yoonia sp.]|uniref:ABC-type transport auxiliary lipoprotein family protein n=1 Tax=Yoonia sp. TaxID=2212373 RepID=UPI003F6B4C8C